MVRDACQPKRTFIGQLPLGADLYESISKICVEEDIKVGKVTALGAVSQATIAYYDQKRKKYKPVKFKKHLEILNCTGNVSLKDGKPVIHMHATFADNRGKAYGGHLTPGTIVFACEVIIDELEGALLVRKPDKKTGLNLWQETSILV